MVAKNMLQSEFTFNRVAAMSVVSIITMRIQGINPTKIPKNMYSSMLLRCIVSVSGLIGIMIGL